MESVGPVFVAGCPRSGTSALSWAIAALPGYWTSAETHFFYYLLRPGSPSVARSYELSAAEGSWLADPEPIANFLATHRVNSSFDRASLAERRFRAANTPELPEDAFERQYGERIRTATAELATQFGYPVG